MVQIRFPNSRQTSGMSFTTATFASDPTTGLAIQPSGDLSVAVKGSTVSQLLSNGTLVCSSISTSKQFILGPATGTPFISNVVVTDAEWVDVQPQLLTSNSSDSYFLVSGANFTPGALVQVDDISALSTAYLSSQQLGVRAPPLVTGTYFLQVIGSYGQTSGKTRTIQYGE